MKRSIAIIAFLLVLGLAAGSWASSAASGQIGESSNNLFRAVADSMTALARLPAGMTEAGILFCLGACLVVLSAVLPRARN